ncbi:hypothetical protein H312_00004 [Anncaliia algerae PRA339]|uniref:Uncharacterized protein n=1 Tax=Anncaliia algerae PRA339 TaxID=1288291 RepID=A0A059F5U2_9MICR|nr:hypothetical protein H312_00004 [Anncaliia algerae PRA339]
MESSHELQENERTRKKRVASANSGNEIEILEEEIIVDRNNKKDRVVQILELEESYIKDENIESYIENETNSKYNTTILYILTNVPIITSVCYIFAIADVIGYIFAIPYVVLIVISCLIRTVLLLTEKKLFANICSGVNTCSMLFILFYFGKNFISTLQPLLLEHILSLISYILNIVCVLPIDYIMIYKSEYYFWFKKIFYVPIFPIIIFLIYKKFITVAVYLICFYLSSIIYGYLGKNAKKFCILLDFLFFMLNIFFIDIIYYGKNINIQSQHIITTPIPN